MENTFGSFLKQKRQEKNLTQKDLSKFLIVSESAISKWEKDVAHPDITLLPKLSEILGVSEHELITASIDNKTREEKAQAKKWRTLSFSWNLFFYISYIVALISCFICNLATARTLSWFWIVFFALLFAFTFTNLPKLIRKYRLIFIPLSMFLSLCLLLSACCIYSYGNWFWIASLSILLGLIIIFTPIYIAKYPVFSKIKKFNDFISIAVDFVFLNILLIVINNYSNVYYLTQPWYFNFALPITACIYLVLNLFLCVRFLKINRLLKTSIILTLINIVCYIVPLFIKTGNPYIKREIDDINIFMANFNSWQVDIALERNVHCIIFLTILILAILFFVSGLVINLKNKKQNKN